MTRLSNHHLQDNHNIVFQNDLGLSSQRHEVCHASEAYVVLRKLTGRGRVPEFETLALPRI